MTEFDRGIEAAAKTLELMAANHAVELNGEYTWINRETLTVAAIMIRTLTKENQSATKSATN